MLEDSSVAASFSSPSFFERHLHIDISHFYIFYVQIDACVFLEFIGIIFEDIIYIYIYIYYMFEKRKNVEGRQDVSKV